MADKPIIMSAAMVKATMCEIQQPGTGKTQTRRILKPQPTFDGKFWHWADGGWSSGTTPCLMPGHSMCAAMNWHVGDRLWIREAWAPLSAITHNDPGCTALIQRGFYRAEESTVDGEIDRWRPSIHMPRRASRFTLIVEDVRVEKLQDISRGDVIAEGVTERNGEPIQGVWAGWHEPYAALWDSLHGPGAWALNPWVAAITFRPILANIDALHAALATPKSEAGG